MRLVHVNLEVIIARLDSFCFIHGFLVHPIPSGCGFLPSVSNCPGRWQLLHVNCSIGETGGIDKRDPGNCPLKSLRIEPIEVQTKEETEESSEDKKDKYQNYSKDVQKRINTLVRRAKEAEERETALANKLRQVEQQTSQTQSQYNTMQDGYYNEFKTRVETQHVLAKDSLKKAYENNDPDQIIAAQELLSRATLDKERLALATADREKRVQAPQEQEIVTPQPRS